MLTDSVYCSERPIPSGGAQYLSGDRQTLLVLGGHALNVHAETGDFGLVGEFGLANTFDISEAMRPRRIEKTLKADGPLVNGAVSEDGSRLAVEILLPEARNPGRIELKVVVLERGRGGLSLPKIVLPRTRMTGLWLVDRFLFVGMQHASPSWSYPVTDAIDLFDIGS